MGEIILKTTIPRESGWLYYCTTDKAGNICVGKSKMQRGGRKSKKK